MADKILPSFMADSGPKWSALSVSLGSLEPIGESIKKVTGFITTALEIQKAILDVIVTLVTDFLNLEAMLIKAAVGAIEAILAQIVGTEVKIHVLAVPPRKQLPQSLQETIDRPQLENSWEINDEISDANKQYFQKLLEKAARYDQGNMGFAKTVLDSLTDEEDPNRPQFDENAAVFGAVIMVGAQSFVGIYALLKLIQDILGTSLRGNRLIPPDVAKTPEELRGKPISAPGTTKKAVQLKWGNPPALQILTKYNGERVRIQELLIARSVNDDEVALAQDWAAVFGTEEPPALGEKDKPKEDVLVKHTHKVIYQMRYDGLKDSFLDMSEDLQFNTDYYYFLAYRYSIAKPNDGETKEADETWEVQPLASISNVAKVKIEDNIPSSKRGPSPNWFATPSFLDLIPDLRFFLILIQNFLDGLKSQAEGANAALKSYVKFLEDEILRYTEYAQEINNRLEKLALILNLPATGIYFTKIDSPKGGNDYFVQELISRLSDETDTTAPPFFKSGVTAGLVLLAGAPNPANLQPVKDLVDLLTGLDAESPFQQALDSIDNALVALEDEITDESFADNMQLFETSTDADEAATDRAAKDAEFKTFDDAMQPTEATDDAANVPFDP